MIVQSRAPGDLASDRTLAVFTGVACALTLCALFWPALQRRVFVYGDLGSFLLPMRIFLAQSLERGETPLWMPHLFCGYYAHGEGAIGIFHPLRWLLYRILPVSEAFTLECLIPYPLALAGMTLFLRRLALPPSAALFGGASFAFSAYMTGRLTHANAIAVIAHVGWLLLAIDAALRETGRRRWRAWLAVALVTASQLLVGYPVAVAYCWLLAIPYALFAASKKVGGLLFVGTALATGILIAGVQVLPTLDHLAGSQRADPTYDYLTVQSLHPLNLLTLVAPWLYRVRLYSDLAGEQNPIEQALYLGPVVPIAALWVLARWRSLGRWRPLAAGLFAVSALALALALGRHTGLYRWIVELPGIGMVRAPARCSIAVYFAGAVFAAIAFADLQRGDPSRGRRWWSLAWIWSVPAASWLVAGIAVALRDPWDQSGFAAQQNSTAMILLGPAVFTLAAALFTAAVSGQRAALYGLVVLALADHAAYGATLWWYDPPQTLAEYRAGIIQAPAVSPERVATARDWGFGGSAERPWYFWSATQWIVFDTRLVSGYAGLMPARRLDYSKTASLRVAGAAWLAMGRWRFSRLPGALPRARIVSRAVPSAQPAADIDTIDVATAALVDEAIALEPGPAGTAAVVRDRPGAIEVDVDAPSRQLLVLAESFHPGWQARVDGIEARVLRTNGDFMGVVVGKGARTVSLSFAPRSFTLGCWTSVVGIAIVAGVAIAGFTRPTHA